MAASNLMAFGHYGHSSADDIESFKQTIARMMSLLSAMMLTHLEGFDALDTERGYDLLDVGSLDMTRVRALAKEDKKTEMVIQWLKVFIIDRMNAGMLTIPAPILTRVFQELDMSVGRYHDAEKLSQIPFPFPYAAAIELSLIIHAFITPVVMMNLLAADNASDNTFLPIPAVGVVIFVLWSMHFIAGELENPYDGDTNDLDLHGMQKDLNEKLQAICKVSERGVRIPTRFFLWANLR